MSDTETELLELTRSEGTTLVGVLQLEKARLRRREDDLTADQLGNIQGRIIQAFDDEEES